MSDHLEIEIKFPIDDPDAVRAELMRAGAISQGKHDEVNVRLDDVERSLKEHNTILRVRRSQVDGDMFNTLTLKTGGAEDKTPILTRHEIEVNVSDTINTEAILEALGYVPYWRYEKRREVFTWRQAEAVLDEMPYGWFMEIEGPEEDIRALAEKVGLDLGEGIPFSYGQIFEHIRRNLGLDLTDATFEAFANVSVPHEAYFPPAEQ